MENTRNVILALQANWTIICRQSLSDHTKITDARVLQRWGTTEGLAQIALHGPTEETRMSEVFDGEVQVMVCAAISGEREASGVCWKPGRTNSS